MDKKNCTVIVNSCDAYADIWYVFFELFRLHWSDCPFPIVLNTESESYCHPGAPKDWIQSFQLYPKNANPKWTNRLIETLKGIETDYVLLFLDDDLIIDTVDTKRILQCIEWMENDSEIMCFRALETGASKKYIPSEKYIGFNRDAPDAFRSSINIMLCRKSQLMKNLIPGENIWEYEGNGMLRSRYWKGEYYSSQTGAPLIPYNANMYGGYGVWHGKWRENTIKLCKDHGIDYDFSIRGILTEEDVHRIREKEILQAEQKKTEKSFRATLSRLYEKLYYLKVFILSRIPKWNR